MAKQEGTLIIKSRGALEFYYSTRCYVEKVADVFNITFFELSLNPPDVLALAVSKKTFSVFSTVYDVDENEEEVPQNVVNFIDFDRDDGVPILKLDFRLFNLLLLKAGAVYREEENGVTMEFSGFVTKDDKKTEQVLFIIEIRTV